MKNILGKILDKIRVLTKKQKIILGASAATLFVVLCLGIGIVCFPMNSEPVEAEKQEEKIEVIVEETEEPITEEVTVEPKKISFSGTSIEKDLKIKIVDETDALVTGTAFKVTVTAQKAKEGTEYTDDDMDGIIYITDMKAGKYTVQLHEMEGFIIAENSLAMTVKDKIEYKKVDVKNEVKQETEIDVKKEDALVQKEQESEPVKNTVELLESSKKESVVLKENVDASNFTEATVSERQKQEAIFDTTTVTFPESATLYYQGGEQSKTCAVTLDISDVAHLVQSIAWQTEAEDIVSLATTPDTLENQKTVTMTALQKGTTNLKAIISYQENGLTRAVLTKDIVISVTVSEFTDETTQLQSKEGEPLYLDKEMKQPATLKDYSAITEFYAPKYTGWQTIEGKTYYYDANHKFVTGVQIIGGARYTFGEDGVLLKTQEQRGIDVSKWQGNIDWNAVANAGIDFAIIRVGYRGYTAGTLVEDSYFKKNIEGATKAGIKVGVYFFTQAVTEAEAVEEASMAISLVSGYKLQLPIYFDTEAVYGSDGSPGRANNLSVSQRTAIAKAFCETVRNAGYMPGVYASTNWYNTKLKASELETYSIWVAHYNVETCGYKGRYDMWQHTSSGSVSGITGRVDLNISYVEY